jgi:RecB family exonuclease
MESSVKEQYSFTKLSAWWTCPYGWKLKYIDGQLGVGNAFSSYGSFVHKLLERYAKEELELWDLAPAFEWGFDVEVPEKFPYNKYVNLRESYYEKGLSFLKSFRGYDKCEILDVERSFECPMTGGWIFNGVIDIVFRDESGRLIIRDYKSKASFKSAVEKMEYTRQLYLYSMYVKEHYGQFPDELQFLMFRKQKVEKIPFDQGAYEEAVGWAENTVKVIRDAFNYPPKCEQFFAANLCNHREYCEFNVNDQ